MQTELPIHVLRAEIEAAVSTHQNAVLAAPTGSGKSTQLPQILRQLRAVPDDKRLIVLQPRRVAARTVAARVASEMGVPLGGLVGYQVRFDDRIGPETKIAFVTEGVLLRWLQSAQNLDDIGAILFDEFHERSVLADLALALCRRLQQTKRPDLRLWVMSATIEVRPVAAFLGECPVLESDGRGYPVELRYDAWDDDRPVWEKASERVFKILREAATGDILVFMPGVFEIEATLDALRRGAGAARETIALLPLHGDMSPAQQDRAFDRGGLRKVIVATNVAETSITLPNIQHVVDAGLVRVAHYEPAKGVNALRIEHVSQASAAQRAGRAGRVGPGVCHRLWSSAKHARLPERSVPEIHRADLAEAVLQLHALGVSEARLFRWFEAPPQEALARAERLLVMLGAVDASGGITSAGSEMLRLPVHPRHARMLQLALQQDCAPAISLFVAALSGRDVLSRVDRNDKITLKARAGLSNEPTTDIALFAAAILRARMLGFEAKACYSFGIQPHAAREAWMAHTQICSLLKLDPDSEVVVDARARRAHLAGYADYLAVRISAGSDEFELAGGRRAELRDDSALRSKRTQSSVVVASDLREIHLRDGKKLALLGAASAIAPFWLREVGLPGLREDEEYVFDRLTKSVVAGRIMRYHDLVLGGERVMTLDPVRSGNKLAETFGYLLYGNRPAPQFASFTPQVRAWVAGKVAAGWSEADVATWLGAQWRGCISIADASQRTLLDSYDQTVKCDNAVS